MKHPFLVWLGLSCTLAAAESPRPSFSEQLMPLPELSLSAAGRPGEVSLPGPDTKPVGAAVRAPAAEPPRLISRLPILAPPRDVDPNFPVATPDPAIDYKLRLIEPRVESVPAPGVRPRLGLRAAPGGAAPVAPPDLLGRRADRDAAIRDFRARNERE